MTHYIMEVWLWMLGLYLIGCPIGALAWRHFGRKDAVLPAASADPQPGPPRKGEGEDEEVA